MGVMPVPTGLEEEGVRRVVMGKRFVKQEAFDAAWWWCVYVAAPNMGWK